MVCPSLGSLLRPLFYFLCSILKANPVVSPIHPIHIFLKLPPNEVDSEADPCVINQDPPSRRGVNSGHSLLIHMYGSAGE